MRIYTVTITVIRNTGGNAVNTANTTGLAALLTPYVSASHPLTAPATAHTDVLTSPSSASSSTAHDGTISSVTLCFNGEEGVHGPCATPSIEGPAYSGASTSALQSWSVRRSKHDFAPGDMLAILAAALWASLLLAFYAGEF